MHQNISTSSFFFPLLFFTQKGIFIPSNKDYKLDIAPSENVVYYILDNISSRSTILKSLVIHLIFYLYSGHLAFSQLLLIFLLLTQMDNLNQKGKQNKSVFLAPLKNKHWPQTNLLLRTEILNIYKKLRFEHDIVLVYPKFRV